MTVDRMISYIKAFYSFENLIALRWVSQLGQHAIYHAHNAADNLLHLSSPNGVWRCEKEMISLPPVSTARCGEKAHVIALLKSSDSHSSCNIQFGIERFFGGLVCHKLDAPKKAATSDIAYVGITPKSLL